MATLCLKCKRSNAFNFTFMFEVESTDSLLLPIQYYCVRRNKLKQVFAEQSAFSDKHRERGMANMNNVNQHNIS